MELQDTSCMEKKKGENGLRKITIASHGEFAKGLKHSTALIVGKLAEDINTFCLYPSQSPMDFKEQIEQEIKQHPEHEYVFLCDIKGGSVHTVCTQLCAYENVKVFSGTNMNLVLDLLLSCPDDIETENRGTLLQNAKEGITLMTRDDLVEKKDEEF